MEEYSSQAEKAYLILKRKILNQEIRQGAPVIERDLADDLNISRTPIREAIRRLDADGLLEIIPRKGSYIRTFTISDLISLYEMAEGLEGMVAYLVAEKSSKGDLLPEDLESLESLIREMLALQSKESYKEWAETDEAFHRKLYYLCDNPFIIESIVRIRTQLNITLFNTIPTFFDFTQSNEEHIALMRSIKAGDSEEARGIIQTQHNRVRNNLIKYSRVSV